MRAAFEPSSALQPADPAEERRRALLDRQLERLDQLAQAGMDMVHALAAQVAGTGPQVVEGDVALAYNRLSRAVRMALLLQSRLVAEPAEAAAGEPEEIIYRWMEPQNSIAERTAARRERIEQIVEGVARREGDDPDTADRIAHEAAERLERDDIYADVLTRPVSELVADLCRDLGLEPHWPSLARQPWAQRERASEDIGWPLRTGLGVHARPPP